MVSMVVVAARHLALGLVGVALLVLTLALTLTPTSMVHASPDSAYVFFPAACSSSGRQCCPDYEGEQCGGPLRGNCTNALAAGLCDDPYGTLAWFTTLFDDVCVCLGNRAGPACDECKDGWTGDDCEEAEPLRVRRPFTSLSEDERQQLRTGLQLLKDTEHPYWAGVDDGNENVNIYNWLVAQHYSAMWPELPEAVVEKFAQGVEFAHGNALLSWHRRYMLSFESHMRRVLGDNNFTMPYWDPTSLLYEEALEFVGGDGNRTSADSFECWTEAPRREGCNCTVTTGPFAGWKTVTEFGRDSELPLQRAFGCDGGQIFPYGSKGLPTPYMVYRYVHELNWQVAQMRVSTLHRNAHGHVGQTMFYGKSPSDPIFFLLHSWIDLIQERWIRNAIINQVYSIDNIIPAAVDINAQAGQSRDECLSPMFPLSTNRAYWYPLVHYGVTYAEFQAADPAVTTPRFIPTEALATVAELGDESEMDLDGSAASGATTTTDDAILVAASDDMSMGMGMRRRAALDSRVTSRVAAATTRQQQRRQQRHRKAAATRAAERRASRHVRRHLALQQKREEQ